MIKKLIAFNALLIVLIVKIPLEDKVSIVEEQQIIETKEEINQEITSRSDEPRQQEIIVEDKTLEGYRVTSYYPGDACLTGTKTGSGKTTNDFTISNIEGVYVYTYEGKIVVAGATNELLKAGYNKKGAQNKQIKHYFNYGDTGKIKINDNWYEFIVLDSCGAAMWQGEYRLDIFVPNKSNIIDTKNIEIVYN